MCCPGGLLGAVGASIEEQLGDAGVVRLRGEHERREAGVSVAEWRGVVDGCAGVQEGDGDFGIAEPAGDAERSLARVVDGVLPLCPARFTFAPQSANSLTISTW